MIKDSYASELGVDNAEPTDLLQESGKKVNQSPSSLVSKTRKSACEEKDILPSVLNAMKNPPPVPLPNNTTDDNDLFRQANSKTLQYCDVTKPLTLQVDASEKGLGAVLYQDKGPVAYACKAMNDTQQNYAQIQKELLAILSLDAKDSTSISMINMLSSRLTTNRLRQYFSSPIKTATHDVTVTGI